MKKYVILAIAMLINVAANASLPSDATCRVALRGQPDRIKACEQACGASTTLNEGLFTCIQRNGI